MEDAAPAPPPVPKRVQGVRTKAASTVTSAVEQYRDLILKPLPPDVTVRPEVSAAAEDDGQWRVGEAVGADGKLLVYHKGMHRSGMGVYKGEFVNGMREGRGNFVYTNGDLYIGVYSVHDAMCLRVCTPAGLAAATPLVIFCILCF